jgi:hypothetical protein
MPFTTLIAADSPISLTFHLIRKSLDGWGQEPDR